MFKILIALIATTAIFAADDFTPPGSIPAKRARFVIEEEKTSRWLASGDFLYWVPEMEGLTFAARQVPDYAVRAVPSLSGKLVDAVVPSVRNKMRTLKGDWEPGVRLSFGYLFDEKGWDLLTSWSYFRNEPSMSIVQKADNRNVAPFFMSKKAGFSSSIVDSAKAEWALFQNSAEIEAGRNFRVGDVFLARPFFGFKGLRVKNKTIFSYNISEPIPAQSELVAKTNFLGLGPRIGGNLSYEFGKGFGMFFLGSGSILYGKFHTSFDGTPERRHALRTVKTMQIQMGSSWKKTFAKKYQFGLFAAWEQNFYTDLNQSFNHFNIDQNQGKPHQEGDLVLKGLTASCHLDF